MNIVGKQINKVLLCSSLVPNVNHHIRKVLINLVPNIKNENRQIVSVFFAFQSLNSNIVKKMPKISLSTAILTVNSVN